MSELNINIIISFALSHKFVIERIKAKFFVLVYALHNTVG